MYVSASKNLGPKINQLDIECSRTLSRLISHVEKQKPLITSGIAVQPQVQSNILVGGPVNAVVMVIPQERMRLA